MHLHMVFVKEKRVAAMFCVHAAGSIFFLNPNASSWDAQLHKKHNIYALAQAQRTQVQGQSIALASCAKRH